MARRARCPACRSNRTSTVYTEPYSGAGVQGYLHRHYEGRASKTPNPFLFQLDRCGECSLAYQAFVPQQQFLDELYNSWIPGSRLDEVARDYSLDDYRYLSEQVDFMVQHLGRPPSKIDVLDFGFGWGHWSRMAMAYGCKVAGVELSEERKRFGESIGIRVMDLEDLPSEGFDFVHTEQVFEHLTDPRAVLERLVAALRPGGLLKISVPDSSAALKKLEAMGDFSALNPRQQMPIAPLEHVNSFTQQSLVAFGKSAALRPLRPNLLKLYNAASGVLEVKRFVKLVARPVYRHIMNRATFVYFTRA